MRRSSEFGSRGYSLEFGSKGPDGVRKEGIFETKGWANRDRSSYDREEMAKDFERIKNMLDEMDEDGEWEEYLKESSTENSLGSANEQSVKSEENDNENKQNTRTEFPYTSKKDFLKAIEFKRLKEYVGTFDRKKYEENPVHYEEMWKLRRKIFRENPANKIVEINNLYKTEDDYYVSFVDGGGGKSSEKLTKEQYNSLLKLLLEERVKDIEERTSRLLDSHLQESPMLSEELKEKIDEESSWQFYLKKSYSEDSVDSKYGENNNSENEQVSTSDLLSTTKEKLLQTIELKHLDRYIGDFDRKKYEENPELYEETWKHKRKTFRENPSNRVVDIDGVYESDGDYYMSYVKGNGEKSTEKINEELYSVARFILMSGRLKYHFNL